MVIKTILLSLTAAFLFFSCESTVNVGNREVSNENADTSLLVESYNVIDPVVNEYLKDELAPIRANFKRINSIDIKDWSLVLEKELNETSEGGEARFYYWNSKLEKIVVRRYAETGQSLSEFYLLNGELSFVLERTCNYNRPIYYDSTMMKENDDTEAFDPQKAETLEDRSYFSKGKMIHAIASGDCGAPFNQEYLDMEEKRLKSQLTILTNMVETK